VPDPLQGNNSTHAIAIGVLPSAVWPWIEQIGHNRSGLVQPRLAGACSGSACRGHSATRVRPEFQDLRVGNEIPYSPFNALAVVALEPERYLIIGKSVAWVLQDLDDRQTRLIVRTRGYGWFKALFRKIPVFGELGAVVDYVTGEPIHD
jgi:hypothetical protein